MPMGSHAHEWDTGKAETKHNMRLCRYSMGEITSVPHHISIPTLDKVSECGKKIQWYFDHGIIDSSCLWSDNLTGSRAGKVLYFRNMKLFIYVVLKYILIWLISILPFRKGLFYYLNLQPFQILPDQFPYQSTASLRNEHRTDCSHRRYVLCSLRNEHRTDCSHYYVRIERT